jgi:hypothetical protein
MHQRLLDCNVVFSLIKVIENQSFENAERVGADFVCGAVVDAKVSASASYVDATPREHDLVTANSLMRIASDKDVVPVLFSSDCAD